MAQARWRSRAGPASRTRRRSGCRSGAPRRPAAAARSVTSCPAVPCWRASPVRRRGRDRGRPRAAPNLTRTPRNAMLATTAPAHRLAMRSDPRRSIRPPRPERRDDADREYRRGEHRKAGDIEMGGRRHHARRKQSQRHECLQPRHGRECRQEVLADLPRRVYHAPDLAGRAPRAGEQMAGGISIHAVDVASGRPGAGHARRDMAHSNPRRRRSPKAGWRRTASSIIRSSGDGHRRPANTKFAFTSANFSPAAPAPSFLTRRAVSASGSTRSTSIIICH